MKKNSKTTDPEQIEVDRNVAKHFLNLELFPLPLKAVPLDFSSNVSLYARTITAYVHPLTKYFKNTIYISLQQKFEFSKKILF